MHYPILLALAVLYTIAGIVIIRRFRKPTCRVCVYREFCPNRESEHSDATAKPCWSCGRPVACSGPAPDSKG